ncbi:MAG: autotransporter-associated beta strand repeat-containing protein [Planctomycetia bacterium]|nr:autotransporter-associated beta strand repeat-containing protein [Planctomycetia bacterium]
MGLILAMGCGMAAYGVEIGSGTTITVTNTDWATKLPDTMNFSGGTLVINPTSDITISRNAVFAANTTSTITSGGSATSLLSGALSGSGTITKGGTTQQLHFSGNNSAFTGTLNVSSNWVNFRNTGAALSSGTVNFNGGTGFVLVPSANGEVFAFGMITSSTGTPEVRVTGGNAYAATIRVGGTNASGTFAGKMLDNSTNTALSVEKVGTGTWTLTGTSSYTGATTISAGTLQLGNGTASGFLGGMMAVDGAYTGTATAITVASGATLAFNNVGNATRTHNTITFNGGNLSVTGAQVNLGGTVAGTELIKIGSGTAFFQGGTTSNNATVTVGKIVVNAGVLANKAALTATTTDITVNDGGTFQIGSATYPKIGSVHASTNITVNTGGTFAVYENTITNAITFDGGNITSNDKNATFSGALDGSGLVKTGTGTITLTQNYAGTVSVSAGKLVSTASVTGNITVNGSSSILQLGLGSEGSSGSLGTNTITLSNGGTFGLNRTDSNNFNLQNSITVSNGGTIANYGSKNLVLQGTVSGNDLTLSNEGTGNLFLQNLSSEWPSDFTGLTGTLTIAKGTVINKNPAVGNAANPLSVVVKDGATLQMGNIYNNSVSQIHGTIELESRANLMLGYAPSGTTATYANDISGAGTISAAYGTTELTGDNSAFTGAVNVGSNYTLIASGDQTLGNSAVTLRSNGTLEVAGDQNLKSLTLGENSDLTLESGTVSVADSFAAASGSEITFLLSNMDSATLDLNGTATFNDVMVYLDTVETLDIWKSYDFLQTAMAEGISFALSTNLLSQGMVLRFTETGYAVQNAAAFPEPATWTLFLLMGVWMWRKRRGA